MKRLLRRAKKRDQPPAARLIADLFARLADGLARRTAPLPRAPRVEEIEPRLLYSADPATLGLALAGAGQVVEQRIVGQDGEFQDSAAVSHELLVVGAGIEDSQVLLDGLATDGRDIEVLMLDPQQDSIAQISAALAGRHDWSAIHILSHGADGQLQLGATTLDSAELAARAGEIGLWGDALQAGADILLYGCDVAADAAGAAFVQQFAALSGADVAASTDLTGAAGASGDWTLEYRTGAIETGIAFGKEAQQQWSGVLETLADSLPADAPDVQNQASVAVAANGNVIVVWSADHAEDGDKHGIFGRIFDAAGNPLGSQFQVNTDFKDEQQNAVLGVAADGSFVVAWQSHSPLNADGDGWSIQAQRFDAGGNRLGAEFTVNGLTAHNQTLPAIAVAADGQFVIAWASDVSNNVYVRHFDAAGNALSGDTIASGINSGGTQTAPSVGIAGDGSYLVAWQSDSGGTGKSVFAQRFNANDTLRGAGFRVNSFDANDQTAPTVAMNGNGYAVIAWTSATQDGDKNGIYAQRYNPDGSAAGAEFLVNTVTANDQSHQSAAIDGAGNFLIAWASTGQDNGGSTGIYAQRYSAAGAAAGAAFLVNTTTAQNQSAPAAALSLNGSAAIAWEGNGVGDANGVFFASYVAANTAPSAGADAASVAQGGQIGSALPGVLGNDADPDAGATLTVAAVALGNSGTPVAVTAAGVTLSGTYGSLLLRADGSYQYSANAAAAYALGAGQFASDVFVYTVRDNFNAASSATLSITVSGANDAPIAANDSYAIDKLGTLSVPAAGVLANDRDADTIPSADTLTVSWVANQAGTKLAAGQAIAGQYGSLMLKADGSLSYSPDLMNAVLTTLLTGDSRTDSFSYQVADGMGAVSTATISIVIQGSNSAPVAAADAYAMQQGDTLAVNAAAGVLANDHDAENNVMSALLVTGPAHGSLNLNPDGSFSYTPNAPYSGSDSFTYRTSDGSLASAGAATVTLTVNHVNHAPVAADDIVAIVQDAATPAASGVLGNDFDADAGDLLSVLEVQSESSGTSVAIAAGNSVTLVSDYGALTIASDGSYSYVANGVASRSLGAGATSSDVFSYTISDGNGGGATASLAFAIAGANDAPTIAGAQAGQAVNDNASAAPFAGVTIGDIDNPQQTLALSVTLDAAAKGALSNLGGGSYDAASGVYSFTGTAAAATAALRGLVFAPTANRVAPGATETTVFTINVSDGSLAASDASTSVVTTSVNDAPAITGIVANQAVNDDASRAPFAGVSIADADSPAQQLTVNVTLDSAAKGALSNLGGGSYDAASGVYSFTGTAAAATTALRGLVFAPTANRVTPGATETVVFTLGVTDGIATVSDASTSVIVTSIDDAPTLAGMVGNQAVNDDASRAPFAGVSIADADSPAQQLTVNVTLDSAAKGALSNLGGGSYDAATGVYSYTGTAAAATAALRGLVFAPTANRVTPGATETTVFTLGVTDGIATVSDASTSVIVTSIDDAPTLAGMVGNQAVNDDGSCAPFAGITIGDSDYPQQTLAVSVTLDAAAKGALSNLGGGSYDAASGVYSFTGTAAAATAALRGLVFAPTANRVAPGATETTVFTINVSDGSLAASDASTSVVTTSVNDAPAITGMVANQAVNDDASAVPFAGVTISDADSPAQQLTVNVTLDSAAKGALSNLGGGSYDAATGVYSYTGTAAAATAALRGLVFAPTANRVTPGATETTVFTLGVTDGIATVSDASTSVIVTSIDDAPTLAGMVGNQAVNDDGSCAPFAGITIGDSDYPQQTLAVSVTLDAAAKGALSNLGGGSYDAASGVYSFTGTAAAATAALRGLVFAPTANRVAPGATETTVFTINVSDGSLAASDASTSVVTTSVNDAPAITGIVANQAVNDDASAVPFAGVSIADADSPAQQLTVNVTLDSAAKGTLSNLGGGSYDAASGVYSFTGTAAAATAALRGLVFAPTANRVTPGASETTIFTLSVSDGIATVGNASTSVASTAINDAPTIAGAANAQAVADDASIAPFPQLTLADADNPAQQLRVSIVLDDAAKGTLTNLGGGSYDAATGIYSYTGSATAATAALRALVFAPTGSRVAPGNTETTVFTIHVSDGAAAESASASVVATAVDHAPVALALGVATTQDARDALPVTLVGSDIDGDSLSFMIASLPANGSLYLDAAGTRPVAAGMLLQAQDNRATLYFRPAALWSGATAFSYAARDAHGMDSQAAEVRLSVAALAAASVAPAAVPVAPGPAVAAEAPAQSQGAATTAPADDSEGAAAKVQLNARSSVAGSAPAALPEALPALPESAPQQALAAPVDKAARSEAARGMQPIASALAVAGMQFGAPLAAAEAAQPQAALDAPGLERSGSAAARSDDIARSLEALRESVKEGEQAEQRVVGASVAAGAGVSIGYVIWLLRGGVLATSLMSSLPAWRFVDPLPVLKNVKQDDDEGDDDSLEAMVRASEDEEHRMKR